jgi:hypothetical protein
MKGPEVVLISFHSKFISVASKLGALERWVSAEPWGGFLQGTPSVSEV